MLAKEIKMYIQAMPKKNLEISALFMTVCNKNNKFLMFVRNPNFLKCLIWPIAYECLFKYYCICKLKKPLTPNIVLRCDAHKNHNGN